MKYILTFLLMWSIPCYSAEWEFVRSNVGKWTENIEFIRMKVPHGWFVKNPTNGNMFFYQDENHEWKV